MFNKMNKKCHITCQSSGQLGAGAIAEAPNCICTLELEVEMILVAYFEKSRVIHPYS